MPPGTPHERWLQPASVAMTRCRRGGAGSGIAMAVLGLMLLGVLPSACTAAGDSSFGESPLIAALTGGVPTAVATPALSTTTAVSVSGAVPLVVLHTNDNWGETEPCG